MDVEGLKNEVDRIRWFHSIDLGNGIVTPGVDRSARRLKGIHMPASLTGMSVLDVGGTFDGFYAFRAETLVDQAFGPPLSGVEMR